MRAERSLKVVLILVGVGCLVSVKPLRAEAPRYDYHNTDAYRALSEEQKSHLNIVQRDFATLWGALDHFADDHHGRVPELLSELVPSYLPELPRDPFATDESAAKSLADKNSSLEGWGYRYRPGAARNRAWCLSSAGLSDFPYLAAQGNIGLYVCKGTWLSGKNIYETQPAKTDKEKIQGDWEIISFERNGVQDKDAVGGTERFDRGKVFIIDKDDPCDTCEFVVALFPEENPKHIDYKSTRPDLEDVEPGQDTMKGIYRLEGDLLIICMSDGGGDRPKKFAAEEGEECCLIHLKRVQ